MDMEMDEILVGSSHVGAMGILPAEPIKHQSVRLFTAEV